MQCPTIKSLYLSFGIGFSLNTHNILLLLLEKTHILNEFSAKHLNFKMTLDSIDVYKK
jgi:hypothetical protein